MADFDPSGWSSSAWIEHIQNAEPVTDSTVPESRRGWNPLWNDIENWANRWAIDHPNNVEPLRALIEALRSGVPLVAVENGMERDQRHLRCSDPPKWWKGHERWMGGADILELGELKSVIEGVGSSAVEDWNAERDRMMDILGDYAVAEEVTKGDPDFSRAEHARNAIDHLKSIEWITKAMCAEIGSDEEGKWLREVISSIAHVAFYAGRHTQAAWGKEFEGLAVERKINLFKFANQNEGRTEHNRQKVKQSKVWKHHATQVRATLSRADKNNISTVARDILTNWDRVGIEGQRPCRPAHGTIRNWLNSEKRVARTRSSECKPD